MLLRHNFHFPQLKIEENTREFIPERFNESDYLKWRAITYKNTPDLLPEPKTCYGCHKEQCKFVADIYLEFCDRQYAKNTGYKRYREQDFSFEFCYSEFLEVVHYNESDQIVEVIQESKGYICLPPNKEERLVYIRHSVDFFFPSFWIGLNFYLTGVCGGVTTSIYRKINTRDIFSIIFLTILGGVILTHQKEFGIYANKEK